METKVCIGCGRELSMKSFKYTSSASSPDSHSSNCKDCLRRIYRGPKLSLKRKKYHHMESWYISCIERDENRCVDCGSLENILVHHIDESRKLGIKKMNNDLSNLVTLCRPCHARRHKYTNDREDVLEYKSMGLSFTEIGKKLGLSRQRSHQLFHVQLRSLKRST